MQRYLFRTQFLILFLLVGSAFSFAQSVDFDGMYFNSSDRQIIDRTHKERLAAKEEARKKKLEARRLKDEARQESMRTLTSSRDQEYNTYASRFNRFNGRCRRVSRVTAYGSVFAFYSVRPNPYYFQPIAYGGYSPYYNPYYSPYGGSIYGGSIYGGSNIYVPNVQNTTYYPVRSTNRNTNVTTNTPRTRTNSNVVSPTYTPTRTKTKSTYYSNGNTSNTNTTNNNSNTRTRVRTHTNTNSNNTYTPTRTRTTTNNNNTRTTTRTTPSRSTRSVTVKRR